MMSSLMPHPLLLVGPGTGSRTNNTLVRHNIAGSNGRDHHNRAPRCAYSGLRLHRACGGAGGRGRSVRQIVRGSDLRRLYGKNSNGISLDTDTAVRRYFDPKLAALIIKDRREAHGEVGKLGSDPFIDAQDWEMDSVDVAVRDTGANKATATVSFKSLGDRRTVTLSSLWSSSRSDGASPISRGIATELCAAF